MPGVSGTAFLAQVKELYPDVVRIMLSGYTELQSVIDAINAGAIYRFLTKPWDDDQLRSVIREAINRQELQRENMQLSRQYREACERLARLDATLQAPEHRRAPRGAAKVSLADTAR